MKNKKVNLNELKVKSFVTKLETGETNNAWAGFNFSTTCITGPICYTVCIQCDVEPVDN